MSTAREATAEVARQRGMTVRCGSPGSAEIPLLSSLPDHIRYALALQHKLRPRWGTARHCPGFRAMVGLRVKPRPRNAGRRGGGEMHRLIRAIADGGAVVILCSTDNQELAELCDRVAVFYQGAMVSELTGLDEHVLLEAVNTGVVQEAA